MNNEPTSSTYRCMQCNHETTYSALKQPPVLQALNAGWQRANTGWICPNCHANGRN